MRSSSRKTLTMILAMSCVLWLYTAPAYADVSDDVAECNDCHGKDGVSTESDVPTIAGLSEFILEEYLLEYRDDARPCRKSKFRFGDTARAEESMCDVAKELSEDKITEIATYYSEKKFVPAKQEFDAALAAEGERIHKRDCDRCHSDGGTLAEDDASILAGQWMPYLKEAFSDYAAGEREMMEDKMKEKIDALDESEKEALLNYYASMQ